LSARAASCLAAERRTVAIVIGQWPGSPRLCPGSPAVATAWLREIKSTLILQPGPAALTDGPDRLAGIIAGWAENRAMNETT
jgi:hypothetical protein